jgi:hypothetical protein
MSHIRYVGHTTNDLSQFRRRRQTFPSEYNTLLALISPPIISQLWESMNYEHDAWRILVAEFRMPNNNRFCASVMLWHYYPRVHTLMATDSDIFRSSCCLFLLLDKYVHDHDRSNVRLLDKSTSYEPTPSA